MKVTFAKVVWFNYIKPLEVNFFGDRSQEMEQKWNEIKKKCIQEANKANWRKKVQIENLYEEAYGLREKVEKRPFWRRLLPTKNEKECLLLISQLILEADSIEEEIKDYTNYVLYKETESFLEKNGFALVQMEMTEANCKTLKVWTLEEK